ncbi:hypothetical protein N7448_004179 [Penicillium atrosanguineum]|nr:hypothetical protein N7448_004179 [Penicillium atrosanguineum]
MRIIIVGAGIAGLSLAIALAQNNHKVLVLDSASQLAEIGAGVQMTPQAVKYFFRWGLKEDIMAHCIMPEKINIKDKDGSMLGAMQMDKMEELYGAPYIVVHRAALHDILHRHAVHAGAELLLDKKVIRYEFENGAVEVKSGKRLEADLVIAADGINSFARSQLLMSSDPGSQPTGWAALRMMAEVSKIQQNPATADLVNLKSYNSNFWIAPDRSCMTYLIKDASMLNIVLSHRDDIDMSKLSYEDHKKVVDDLFGDFEQPVQQLLNLALPNIVNYPVYAVPPLPHWTHSSGRFTLLGDAAHAMAFYMSMGVSLAVEDAVSLATILSLTCPDSRTVPEAKSLKNALTVFEEVRKRRAVNVQRASLRAGDSFHVPDGKEREAMYELMRHTNEDFDVAKEPLDSTSQERDEINRAVGGIGNKKTRDWCYGYDAVGDVMAAYQAKLE